MSFNQGSFNNSSNQNSGNGTKSSWRIGKDNIRAKNGKLRVALYESKSNNPFCSVQILSEIGRDPQTNEPMYENKPPMEIPSVLITHEMLEAIINRFTDKTRPSKDSDFFPNWVDTNGINESFDTGRGSKIQFTGTPNEMTIRIEKEGKDRTCTFTGIPLSSGCDVAMWRMFLQKLYYVLSYMRTAGIDPDKFSTAMSSSGFTMTQDNSANDMDVPFNA
jgi:hypothetical protein